MKLCKKIKAYKSYKKTMCMTETLQLGYLTGTDRYWQVLAGTGRYWQVG